MRCDEFELRLHEALDERREPMNDAALAAHAQSCDECRRSAAALRTCLAALADFAAPRPSDGFAERVRASLRGARSVGPRRINPAGLAATLFAVAATLLLAALPVWRQFTNPQPHDASGDARSIAVAPPDAVRGPVDAAALTPSLADLARQTQDSYLQLADDARRSLGDALAVTSLFAADDEPEPVPGDGEQGWIDRVGGDLAPLADSTLGTLDVLRQIVPSDKETRS